MSKLKKIKGKVVKYSSLPKALIPEWIKKHRLGAFIECHIDDEEWDDECSKWLKKTYKGIENNTFYIEIDY